MKAVTHILCSTLAIFNNSVQSAIRQHKDDAVHPFPIQLNIHRIGVVGSVATHILRSGMYHVATTQDEKYIIGVMIGQQLYPLMAPRPNVPNTYWKVKVRIDGDHASVTVPIPRGDPMNLLFLPRHVQELKIRRAFVPEVQE